MPSLWMEHPRRRLAVPMGDCTAWLAQGRFVKVSYDISSQAQVERKRLWVAKVTKAAKKQVADMVGKRCPVGKLFSPAKSLDVVKDKVLFAVATGVNDHGNPVFLASDGNVYKFSTRMVAANQHLLVASRDNPLVFVRGAVSKQLTVRGYKQYPNATMEVFCRSSCEKWLPDLAAYFYGESDWVKYGDILA